MNRANRLRASASVRTAVFYEAMLDSHSTAALAHYRPAVLAGRLSAVLTRLFYATLAGGRPCCKSDSPQFTLPDSPQQIGIVERRIGLVMEVTRTSMIHAAAPHFLWPFAVRYAAHQLNLWPRVSLPETLPTLRWTGKVGDASVFRVWGYRAFVRDTSADKLSARAIPCVFLCFVPDEPGWKFNHPTLCRVLLSQDVMFDESVPFYRLFPYRSAPPLPPPLFLAPGPPPLDPLPPQGPAPSGVSQVDPLPGTAPVQVAIVSGAAPGAASGGVASGGVASGGAEPGGAGSEGAGSGGAEPEGVEPGGAELVGAESGGAEPRGAASSGGHAGDSPRLSSQQLREWLVRCPHRQSGAPAAGGAVDTGAGGAAVPSGAVGIGGVGCAGAGDPTEPGAAGTVGTGAGEAGVGGPGAGGAGAAGAGVGGTSAGGARAAGPGAGANDPGAGGAGATLRPRPYFVPLVFLLPSCVHRLTSCSRRYSQPPHCLFPLLTLSSPEVLQSVVSLRLVLSRLFALLVALLNCVLLLSPARMLWHSCDRARAASPTVARLLAIAVTYPYFESAATSALVAELLDFAAACRLYYATALVAESESASPPSVEGECALGTDVLEDRQEDFECLAATVPRFASMLLAPEEDPDAPDIPTPRSYAEAITGPYSSQWQVAMDAEMASWKSTGTYVDEVPPPGANIVDGMWIFKGSLHEEIRLRRPPGCTGTFPAGTQWSLCRLVYGLRQVPREWHDTLRTTLAALGFAPSTADPSLFLRTNTSLPPFYVQVYVHNLVVATPDTEALTLVKSELQKRHTCTDLGKLRSYLGLQITRDRAQRTMTLTQSHMVHQVLQRFGFQISSPQLTPVSTSHSLSAPPSYESVEPSDASWVDDSATQRSSQGYTFSLVSSSVSWPSTRSSSVLSSSCEAEIYAGDMAAQELRWLTYLLTDLGEQPCSPPVLYVDNKAMIALC
ncbi:unnamed protein product [Closterium sp. NIES-54]